MWSSKKKIRVSLQFIEYDIYYPTLYYHFKLKFVYSHFTQGASTVDYLNHTYDKRKLGSTLFGDRYL